MNRKKPPIHVWPVREELVKNTRNPEAIQTNIRHGYISTVYFDENLTKSEAVVNYGICTRHCQEGVWDFPVMI